MVLLDLILHAGKGKCGPLHLDAEDLPVLRGTAQGVDVLAGRKRQAEQLAGPVDELTGGDVRRAADPLGMHAALLLRRDAQKLRRTAGKMPGQMRLVHQLHMAGAPQRGRDVPLLVRKRQDGHAERRTEHACLRFAREEAGHI